MRTKFNRVVDPTVYSLEDHYRYNPQLNPYLAINFTSSTSIRIPKPFGDPGRPNGMTMEAWIMTDSLSETWPVWTGNNNASPYSIASIGMDNQGRYRAFTYLSGQHFVTAPSPVVVGEWVHVAFTTGIGGAKNLYINGKLVGTTKESQYSRSEVQNDAMVLGGTNNDGVSKPGFVGKFYRARLWNIELTAAQLAASSQVGYEQIREELPYLILDVSMHKEKGLLCRDANGKHIAFSNTGLSTSKNIPNVRG